MLICRATQTLTSTYSYGYDALGHITQTTTLSGTDVITHDALGRLTDECGPQVLAAGGRDHWSYDGNGNLLTQTDDSGVPVTYTLLAGQVNELGTLSSVPGSPTTYYSYDNSGDTTRITNTVWVTQPMSTAAINTSLSYEEDGQGKVVTLTDVNGNVVHHLTGAYTAREWWRAARAAHAPPRSCP